jgi:hypothetical protein
VQVVEFPGDGGLFPDALLHRGDLVLLQYSEPTGRFLMALVREKNRWKVLEPALPM